MVGVIMIVVVKKRVRSGGRLFGDRCREGWAGAK